MADLNSLQAAETVKIAGTNSSGIETGFVAASSNGDLKTADVVNTSAVQATLTITTSAVQAKVGGSALSERKMLIIQCKTNGIVYGYSSSSQPFDLPKGTTLVLPCGPNITVWLRKTSGSGDVAVAELS